MKRGVLARIALLDKGLTEVKTLNRGQKLDAGPVFRVCFPSVPVKVGTTPR
jgi:hypothetical protein